MPDATGLCRSEEAVLFAQRAEGSQVGDGECEGQRGLIADAGVVPAVLDAEAAAIGVVSHLRGGVQDQGPAVVVHALDAGVPAAAVGVAKIEAAAKLVSGRAGEPDHAVRVDKYGIRDLDFVMPGRDMEPGTPAVIER